jgi:predicted alpha-1,2-mannosidase
VTGPGRRRGRRIGLAGIVAVSGALCLACCGVASCTLGAPGPQSPSFDPVADPASYVDPFVGTGSGGGFVGNVNTFPGADLPFGMVQWSPDTNSPDPLQPAVGGYAYNGTLIRGFSVTHLSGAGCPAAGDFPVMPYPGAVTLSPLASPSTYTAGFDHRHETARPGYYALRMDDGVGVRLSVTRRTGIAEMSFPPGPTSSVVIDPEGSETVVSAADITVQGDDLVTASATAPPICGGQGSYTVYFAAKFQRPFKSFGVWQGGTLLPGVRATSSTLGGAWVSFAGGGTVTMKVAISYVSVAGALANLAAEQKGWSLERVAKRATADWNSYLGRIQVEGGSSALRRVLYTALYHCLLFPSVFSDDDGHYTGMDDRLHRAVGYPQYTNISEWDVYRSEVPLLALLAPKVADGVVTSMLRDYQQTGWLPRWAYNDVQTNEMGGDSADPIIASAYAMGARDFDARLALDAMVKGATETGTGPDGYVERPGLAGYLAYGYVPYGADALSVGLQTGADTPDSASLTLEYNLDDFAIAKFASALGERSLASKLLARSKSWEKLYDPATGWLAPVEPDGSFPPGWPSGSRDFSMAIERLFHDDGTGQLGFQEGDQEQYTFMVPEDVPALVRLMGGRDAFDKRLEAFFSHLNAGPIAPYDWAGNEPSLDTPWIASLAGSPQISQEVVHRILATLYKDAPGGEPGNDDLGAMASWAVWALLGLYPAVPGEANLVVGTPSFAAERVDLAGGRAISLAASGEGHYVSSVSVNGKVLHKLLLDASAVSKGAYLTVQLSTRR